MSLQILASLCVASCLVPTYAPPAPSKLPWEASRSRSHTAVAQAPLRGLRGGGAWDSIRGTAMDAASRLLSGHAGESVEQTNDESSARPPGAKGWMPWCGTKQRFDDEEEETILLDNTSPRPADPGVKRAFDYSKFDDVSGGSVNTSPS